jgi:glycerophosphoryl diester phosphodiesterase
LPQLRPDSAAYDGREAIPTYQEVIDLAKAESRRAGRTVGTYPEMKHPSYFRALDLALEERLAGILRRNGLDSRTAPVFLQCFEPDPLKRFGTLSKARRVMLVGQGSAPVDVKTAAGLRAIAAFAEGLGPEWPLVLQVDEKLGPSLPVTRSTGLVPAAHAAGLVVHPWTLRAENAFLPKPLQQGADPKGFGRMDVLLHGLAHEGVDGVFSDFPRLATEGLKAFAAGRG